MLSQQMFTKEEKCLEGPEAKERDSGSQGFQVAPT